jgi:hypothetical protein
LLHHANGTPGVSGCFLVRLMYILIPKLRVVFCFKTREKSADQELHTIRDMAEINRIHAATETVPCTKEQFEQLRRLLPYEEIEVEISESHGFQIELLDDRDLFLFAERDGMVDNLPPRFRKALGSLLSAAGEPYLEVGFADTCYRVFSGSHAGGSWRLYPDGRIKYAKLIYAD